MVPKQIPSMQSRCNYLGGRSRVVVVVILAVVVDIWCVNSCA